MPVMISRACAKLVAPHWEDSASMPSFEVTRKVKHDARDMFALVADVKNYPKFVPLCDRLTLISHEDREDGTTCLIAKMGVAYKMIRESFTCEVILNPNSLYIEVSYLDGPFTHMHNKWRFHQEEEGEKSCNITFSIDYAFKSRALSLLMGAVFDKAFRKFATAFEQRADEVYGQ